MIVYNNCQQNRHIIKALDVIIKAELNEYRN